VRLLLDTHTFLWFVWNDPRLSAGARALLESPLNELLLSAASAWEIGIKVGTGKLAVGQDLDLFLPEQMSRNRVSLLSIAISHVAAMSRMPFHHKDPFDRLLVAQCLTEKIPLVSADVPLDAYGIERLW
jgi:PIN domain nuclease of toxin-antitoxin system